MEFMQFIIDYLPDDMESKSILNKYLKARDSDLYKDLIRDRRNLVLRVNKSLNLLKHYLSNHSIEDALNLIKFLIKYIETIENYDTSSVFLNFEHEDILIDTMIEIKDMYQLITDDLNEKRIGPVFSSYLSNIQSFLIFLVKENLEEISRSWSLGKIKLDNLRKNHENLNYFEIERDIKTNMIIAKNGVLINLNYPILAPIGKNNFKYHSKRLGLIINSKSLEKRVQLFIKEFDSNLPL